VDPQTDAIGRRIGRVVPDPTRDGVSQGNRQWRDQTIRAGTAAG